MKLRKVSDMFMTERAGEVMKAVEGLTGPCDAELNVDGDGYTLKTESLEDLATAAMFFRDAVDGMKNTPTPHIVVEVDTSRISELAREAQDCIDKAVADMHVVCADTDSVFVCGLNGGMSTGKVASKFNDHFTDGGTPKKQVRIKISDIKRPKFIHSLCASTRDRKSISDRDFDEASFRWYDDEDDTHCIMKLRDMEVVGITRKHPNNVYNEYTGKTMSFNRAFDKLEKAVLKVNANRKYGVMADISRCDDTIKGVAIQDISNGEHGNVRIEGNIYRCIAGKSIKKGDLIYADVDGKVYPKKSKRPFYHGGIDFACEPQGYSGGRVEFDFESTCGSIPKNSNIKDGDALQHVFIGGVWKWISVPQYAVKSECTDKETKSDDITITMSRKEAQSLYKTLSKTDDNNRQYWDLFNALK